MEGEGGGDEVEGGTEDVGEAGEEGEEEGAYVRRGGLRL